MPKVRLTILESRCRDGLYKAGDEFIVDNTCPPICHELWHNIYPSVYVLLNGGQLDYGDTKAKRFEHRCSDGGRVLIRGEVIEE